MLKLFLFLGLVISVVIVTFGPDVIDTTKQEYDKKYGEVLEEANSLKNAFIERSTKRKETLNRLLNNFRLTKQEVKGKLRARKDSTAVSVVASTASSLLQGYVASLFFGGIVLQVVGCGISAGLRMLNTVAIPKVDEDRFQQSIKELEILGRNVESDYNNMVIIFKFVERIDGLMKEGLDLTYLMTYIDRFIKEDEARPTIIEEFLKKEKLTTINFSTDDIAAEKFGEDTPLEKARIFVSSAQAQLENFNSVVQTAGKLMKYSPQSVLKDGVAKVAQVVSKVVFKVLSALNLASFVFDIATIIGSDTNMDIDILDSFIAKTEMLITVVSKLCWSMEYRMESIMAATLLQSNM